MPADRALSLARPEEVGPGLPMQPAPDQAQVAAALMAGEPVVVEPLAVLQVPEAGAANQLWRAQHRRFFCLVLRFQAGPTLDVSRWCWRASFSSCDSAR